MSEPLQIQSRQQSGAYHHCKPVYLEIYNKLSRSSIGYIVSGYGLVKFPIRCSSKALIASIILVEQSTSYQYLQEILKNLFLSIWPMYPPLI